MGARQKTLQNWLCDAGYPICTQRVPRPCDIPLPNVLRHEAQRVYAWLGGVLPEFELNLTGGWDVEVANIAIELDEEQHFNRYRRRTLDSPIYRRLPAFPLVAYRRYCDDYEAACLKKGRGQRGYWTKQRCVDQFGEGAPIGDLEAPGGAPRWKQRAFYDFVKDMAPLYLGIPLARLTVWDSVTVDGATGTIAEVLDRKVERALPAMLEVLELRVSPWLI